ncbi:DrmB family protein [Candidatus Corynebacterium faecigallinarum]|uniref:DrmB family protein n=1 Tax=Candidatus Corynebacterium faecigallinarum TaxID=2838528 RepID=UPI003FD2BBCE
MKKIRHDLRLSETVSPFGVGAIVDIQGESLIAPDTSWWDRKVAPEIHCDRLVDQLVQGGRPRPVLRQAPSHAGKAGQETANLPYRRFPAWRFCERCLRLSKLTTIDKGRYRNQCGCGGMLVPMRYVAVCKTGSHVQDIPWLKWAHRGHDAEKTDKVRFCHSNSELRFVRSNTSGEGLASLRVVCDKCGRSRPLSDLMGNGALHRDGIRCESRQPWEREDSVVDPCDDDLVAVQRGATGNYIAERVSALDIPEEKTRSEDVIAKIQAHDYFQRLVDDNGGPKSEMIAEWIAEEVGVDADAVLSVADGDENSGNGGIPALKDGEWAAFAKKIANGKDQEIDNFVVDGWPNASFTSEPSELRDVIAGIGQVHRVREVRALKGFRRHSPNASFINADLGKDTKQRPVYPSLELFGEGIFIQFDEEKLQEWEALPDVQARAHILMGRREKLEWARSRLDVPEPRFIALHTIAHLLIRRLAFASGYSSAALQERIYASTERPDHTGGILIYTAAGDAQGTLGGLVRLGAPKLLIPLLIAALDDADVCSNDPVCIESDRQGSSQLNLSACHGCTLVSETSCETGNRLLDRQLVLGGSEVTGLLQQVLPTIREGIGYSR